MPVVYSVVLAGFINLLLIPLVLYVSHKRAWFDQPDERKIHSHQIPRLGGIGIFWSFIIALAIGGVIFLGSEETLNVVRLYWPAVIAALLIHLTGLFDDFANLRALFKFLVQIAAAVLVVSFGYRFTSIWLPFLEGPLELGFFGYPLTVLWIVGVINAVNLIDGMDGLCAGISGFAAMVIGMILLGNGQTIPALIAFVLAGSLAGYLFYNFPPATIFMGDSGSTFLGFMLAVLPLLDVSGRNPGMWFWDGALIMVIPIFDTISSMIRRKKSGAPVMAPDQWHLHHKLLKLGLSVRSILNFIYPTMIVIGTSVVSVLFVSPMLHWIIVIATFAMVLAGFLILHYLKESRLSNHVNIRETK